MAYNIEYEKRWVMKFFEENLAAQWNKEEKARNVKVEYSLNKSTYSFYT